ncbi:MAG: hypothetical protein KAI94_08405 [Anaerolineales bacterium]|nr:hypothetical protein [Anaerolineales bacterium]MCK5429478.1 hypothetical protein [Anaerolineales bacterium]
MSEIYQIGIYGWSGLAVILAVMLVLAWRLIVYANSSADSPYVVDILQEVESGEGGHDVGHH